MSNQYSVADTRRDLPQILREVEGGAWVQITRRGEPVAVLISLSEYRRLSGEGGSFLESYKLWEDATAAEDRAITADFFDELRERSPGREVDL